MRVEVVTPPEPIVTLEDAISHLKNDFVGEEAYVEALIAAASGTIDGPDGWLGRAIGLQTLQVFAPDFGADNTLRLPFLPIVEIEEVAVRQSDGAWVVLDPAAYELRGDRLAPTWGGAWPSVPCEAESVRVRYVAGYDVTPAPIVAAVLLMVGDLFRNRTTVSIGLSASSVPMSLKVEKLLGALMVYR